MISTLVSTINGIAMTNTMAIADGTETEHASVIKLVRTYQSDHDCAIACETASWLSGLS